MFSEVASRHYLLWVLYCFGGNPIMNCEFRVCIPLGASENIALNQVLCIGMNICLQKRLADGISIIVGSLNIR